jgi:hypothetical protein
VQQFFHEQLRCQNVSALEFLSEHAVVDDRVCTALLYPYYQSLLPQAVENTPEMAIFQKQLKREDGMVEAFLVQQIEKGRDDAFRVLWVNYRLGIFRYVKGMIGDETVAEDLIADTFLKAWRSLPNRRNKERNMLPMVLCASTTQGELLFPGKPLCHMSSKLLKPYNMHKSRGNSPGCEAGEPIIA